MGNDTAPLLSIIADWISIIAGVISILGIGGVITWGLGKHLKNTIANRVYIVSIKMFKMGLISLYLFILFFIWQAMYSQLIAIATGAFHYKYFYWDSNKPFQYLIAYIISGSIFFFFFVIGSICLYTGSLLPFKQLWKKWQDSKFVFDDTEERKVKILLAEFGNRGNFKDKANIVKQFITDKKLEFIVDKKLFGDHLPKVPKILRLKLLINGKEFIKEYNEKDHVLIEFDKFY